MKMKHLPFLLMLLSTRFALSSPLEKKSSPSEILTEVKKEPRSLAELSDESSKGTSQRFFGGTPPFTRPMGGFFSNSPDHANFGGLQPSPYFPSYGYTNMPFNYGSFYPVNPSYYQVNPSFFPVNPNFFGNSFGGFSTTQQQQQQQVSQIGTSGLQPNFSG